MNTKLNHQLYRIFFAGLVLTAATGLARDASVAGTFGDHVGTMHFKSDFIGEYPAPVLKKSLQKSGVQLVEPFWSVSFDSPSDMDQFTIIDANGDSSLDVNDTRNGIYGTWRYCDIRGCETSPVAGSAGYYVSQTFTTDADDWLITPGFDLKKGKSYVLRFWGCGNQYSNERLEVKYGTSPTVEGQSIEVLEPTVLDQGTYNRTEGFEEFVKIISPSADGIYYIGFHAISDKAKFILAIDDISLEDAPDPASPGMCSGLTVTADAGGALKAIVKLTAPVTDNAGNALPASDKFGIKIFNGEKVVADIKDVTAGKDIEFIDSFFEEPGDVTYTVVAYNDKGYGTAAYAVAYVGLDSPATPSSAIVADADDYISVSWEPSESLHGGPMPSSDVKYEIWSMHYDAMYGYQKDNLEASVVGETSARIEINPNEGNPRAVYYGIYASNASGECEMPAFTNTLVIGKPQPVPFSESFGSKNFDNFWTITRGYGPGWGRYSGFSFDTEDFDDSGTSLVFITNGDDHGTFSTGKLSLASTQAPKLIFSHKSQSEEITFAAVITCPDGTEKKVYTSSATVENWVTETIDISEFKDLAYIYLSFTFDFPTIGGNSPKAWLDAVKIMDVNDVDLAISLVTPEDIRKGEETLLKVKVANEGKNRVEKFVVTVTENGNVVSEKSFEEVIPSQKFVWLEFPWKPSVLNKENQTVVMASVNVEGDIVENNNSALAEVGVADPEVAPAENLNAVRDKETVRLFWQNPSVTVFNHTDNFDDISAWDYSTDINGWTMIDRDEAYTYGFYSDLRFTGQGMPFAFIVFDPYDYGGADVTKSNPSLIPHSGRQMLAAVHARKFNMETMRQEDSAADNWMISPKLSGNAQKISFFARAYYLAQEEGEMDYPEECEVLYSTTDKSPDNFHKLGETITVQGPAWKEIEVELPEGSTYFAIRHVTETPFIFLVDDISYETGFGKIQGYNVYRNDNFISTVTGNDFNHMETEAGDYAVSVLYASGLESLPIFASVESDLGDVEEITMAPELYTVYTMTGILLFRDADSLDSLSPGLYIINGKKALVE